MTMSFENVPPVVPGPLDTAAIWGASRESQVPSEGRPHLSPGRPPWEPEQPQGRRPIYLVAIVAGLVLIVAAVFGVVAQRSNILPVWVPLIGKDTGIAACQALAGGDKLTTLNEGDGRVRGSRMSEAEYRAIRGVFTGSRYSEIRTNGQQLIDYAWQLQSLGPDAGLAALPLVGPIQQAYAGLSGGCSEQGYDIPAFGS